MGAGMRGRWAWAAGAKQTCSCCDGLRMRAASAKGHARAPAQKRARVPWFENTTYRAPLATPTHTKSGSTLRRTPARTPPLRPPAAICEQVVGQDVGRAAARGPQVDPATRSVLRHQECQEVRGARGGRGPGLHVMPMQLASAPRRDPPPWVAPRRGRGAARRDRTRPSTPHLFAQGPGQRLHPGGDPVAILPVRDRDALVPERDQHGAQEGQLEAAGQVPQGAHAGAGAGRRRSCCCCCSAAAAAAAAAAARLLPLPLLLLLPLLPLPLPPLLLQPAAHLPRQEAAALRPRHVLRWRAEARHPVRAGAGGDGDRRRGRRRAGAAAQHLQLPAQPELQVGGRATGRRAAARAGRLPASPQRARSPSGARSLLQGRVPGGGGQGGRRSGQAAAGELASQVGCRAFAPAGAAAN
jgi:hypothetical protein